MGFGGIGGIGLPTYLDFGFYCRHNVPTSELSFWGDRIATAVSLRVHEDLILTTNWGSR